jgi:hypothetical protein
MKRLIFVAVWTLAVASLSHAQAGDHLSPEEIKAAVAAKSNSGFVFIEDGGFTTPTNCQAQMPSEALFTPSGWINALSMNSRKQFLPFNPDPDDTVRALTVISKGCASGSDAGPVCDSITRVVLLSDKQGSITIEAASQRGLSQSWQNGFGASASCAGLVSRFKLSDVQRVRGAKGEFIIATFSGPTLLKMYTVKEKHLKKLGM